jgi:hypothetical protein
MKLIIFKSITALPANAEDRHQKIQTRRSIARSVNPSFRAEHHQRGLDAGRQSKRIVIPESIEIELNCCVWRTAYALAGFLWALVRRPPRRQH